MLGKAVADSKEKAKVLAEAASVALGNIITVDYSWGEIEFSSTPMNRMLALDECEMCAPCDSYDIDIEPDDIDVSDTVTVIWSIV